MKVVRSLIAFCLLLLPTLAWAQAGGAGDDARNSASAHFRRGVELFQEEAYRASLAEFQRAYDISPDYRLLYNIAQAKIEIHDYLGAAESYERYLSGGGDQVPAERRAEVEQALAALRERVASVEIAVSRPGAEVFIDDVKIGTSPLIGSVRVNVGGHRIMARTDYGSTDTEVIDVAGGDRVKVTLELAAPVSAQRQAAAPEKKPWNASEKAAVATWSLAGALGVGALTTALLASAAQDDFDKLLKTPDVSSGEIADQRDKTHRLGITTDILMGTAVASAVAGTLAWVFGHKKEQKPEATNKAALSNVRWNPGFGSLNVSGRF
jgi:tetratricopeptide (TPR) repeat protein